MSKAFIKRVDKEIQNFNDKKYLENNNYSQKVTNFLDNLNVKIIIGDLQYFLLIKNLKNNKIFLELEIPDQYPFKPYSVVDYDSIYRKVDYLKHLNNIYQKIKHRDVNIYKFFYKNLYELNPKFLNLQKDKCFCCYAITCSELWYPSITFNNLILEHLEIQFIENYSSQTGYKYLDNIYGNLLNNIFTKLPGEIIEKILNC